MNGNNTANTQALIKNELWQQQLEEILHEDIGLLPFVRQVDFPDGIAFTMPSIGTPVVRDYPEGSEATFDALDSGEVTITMNAPVIAANSVTEVLLEDSSWSQELVSSIPVEQAIAIQERFETDVFALAMHQSQGTNDANLINGAAHRRIGQGTAQSMDVSDFAKAGYSLRIAKVPRTNLVAFVHPSVAHTLETQTNIVNISNNPKWEGIIETGLAKDHRFVKNIYGFDIFESVLLPEMNETIGGDTTTTGVANLFMSLARPTIAPFTLAWRRQPTMRSWVDESTGDLRTKTTARWGSGLTRDENLVVIGTDIGTI